MPVSVSIYTDILQLIVTHLHQDVHCDLFIVKYVLQNKISDVFYSENWFSFCAPNCDQVLLICFLEGEISDFPCFSMKEPVFLINLDLINCFAV